MTDETEDQEHVCYGVMRLMTPLPIEEQQAGGSRSRAAGDHARAAETRAAIRGGQPT